MCGQVRLGQQVEQQDAGGGLVARGQCQVGGLLRVPAPLGRLAGLAEVPGELGDRPGRAALQRAAGPAMQRPAFRHGDPCVHRAGREHVPERHLGRGGGVEASRAPACLGEQPAAQHLGQGLAEPGGRQPGHGAQQRLVRGVGKHGRRGQDCPGVRSEPPAAFQHAVPDRRRDRDLAEAPPRPATVAARQVGAVVHEPHHLLDGQRDAVGALLQERGERVRHPLAVEHRGDQPERLGDSQWLQREPQPCRSARHPGREPQQQRVTGHVLGPVGQHQAGPRPLRAAEEQQELQGRLVCPLHVLDDKHAHLQAGQQLVKRAEQPVPGCGRVLGRLRRRGQFGGPFGEQRPQGSGQAAQPGLWRAGGRVPDRVHERAQRARPPERRAPRDQALHLAVRPVQELPD